MKGMYKARVFLLAALLLFLLRQMIVGNSFPAFWCLNALNLSPLFRYLDLGSVIYWICMAKMNIKRQFSIWPLGCDYSTRSMLLIRNRLTRKRSALRKVHSLHFDSVPPRVKWVPTPKRKSRTRLGCFVVY